MIIALIGYGKMGKTIEQIALHRGHQIGAIIDPMNDMTFENQDLNNIDVAIEFTRPEAAVENIVKCIALKIPIVCGTTGWLASLPEIQSKLEEHEGSALFYSSNFSLGVNVFFEINRKLAALMNPLSDYAIKIEEIHHTQKLDAPSGTAITIAEDILNYITRKSKWVNQTTEVEDELEIISKRLDDTLGTHSIKYLSDVDQIEIIHTAKSRHGFALGALIAAEWTLGRSGLLNMKQMLNL